MAACETAHEERCVEPTVILEEISGIGSARDPADCVQDLVFGSGRAVVIG